MYRAGELACSPRLPMTPESFNVGPRDAGIDLTGWLKTHLHLPWPDLRELIRAGRVVVDGAPCLDPSRRLRRGQRVEVRTAKSRRGQKQKGSTQAGSPQSLAPECLLFLDDHIVVVDKPPGLTTMRHADDVAEFGARAKRFLPTTLAELLPRLIARREKAPVRPLRAVHRLDKETSGLLVFARTVAAEKHLGQQFRAHSVDRLYRAVVRGHGKDGRIESNLVANRGDGRRGSTTRQKDGQHAVTHVHTIETLGDFTLVECRLETGRTHQLRIHLGEAGTPLCGERIYDRPLHGAPVPDKSGMKRVALHAALLGLEHPALGQRMQWISDLPKDMADLLTRLRRKGRGGGSDPV